MMKKILLIYTGGTIGMQKKSSDSLVPFNFDSILNFFPELNDCDASIDHVSTKHAIDSSDMKAESWIEIANLISENYNQYDSFVILHGTDTMSYTASALSFMLEGLNKAVILTGSQIPIGARRTDAKENLITSIEIAASDKISEVCVYFEDKLLRGNRVVKVNTEQFEAFESPNFPEIAEVGIKIKYNRNLIRKKTDEYLKISTHLNGNVSLIKFFPGLKNEIISAIINSSEAIILESFGSGNLSSDKEFLHIIKQAILQNKVIVNCSQCLKGSVEQSKYENSSELEKIGVISAFDMTTESAITKLMYLLGKGLNPEAVKKQFSISLRGEISN